MNIIRYAKDRDALRALTSALLTFVSEGRGNRPFNLALSGGETAKLMFQLWREEYANKIQWSDMVFYWVDERCVPPDDEDSNFGQADRLLFQPLSIPPKCIHRIRGEENPEEEAMRYAQSVKDTLPSWDKQPYFDCAILGVGGDMHTASIFPHLSRLLTDERLYATSQHPETHQQRVTMTGTFILRTPHLLVPILGRSKTAVIERLQKVNSTENDTPAGYIISKARQVEIFVCTEE